VHRPKKDHLSFIVISGDHRQIRRWEGSRMWFRAAVAAGVLLVAALGVTTFGMIHYWQGYKQTADIRVQNAQYDQERAVLVAKLEQLEATVDGVNRLAARLESAGQVPDKGILTAGIGPISESVELPSLHAHGAIDQLQLNAQPGDEPTIAFQDVGQRMRHLDDRIDHVHGRVNKVYKVKRQRNAFWAAVPSRWPVRGWVTSGFGPRRRNRAGGTRFHEGVDIAAPVGTPIFASGDGVVSYAGYKGGYGRSIIIDHGFGMTSLYGHNAQLLVKEGTHVRRGMQIATIGMTGRTTGPHVHYQVSIDGIPVDPLRYLASR
jgi:murein DD-endopeptidase MepM/ murein hydrolase activator NlpD